MKTRFYNANILCNANSTILYGEVWVENGRIVNVFSCDDGKLAKKECFDREIDCSDKILMPGFVNAHAHTPMCVLRGQGADKPLDDWLFGSIIPKELKLKNEDIYWAEMLGIAEYVRAGITSFDEGYAHTVAMADAITKSGIRARLNIGNRQLGNKKQKTLTELFDKDLEMLKSKSPLIKPVVYMHSIYTCSEEEIAEAVTYAAQHKLPVAIHLAETLKEVGECDSLRGKSPTAFLEDIGFLDRKATCFHCVHVDKDDLQILADYGVSVVTCQSSNLKLGSGIAPVNAMLTKGINVAIGTDGVASNNSADMFKEMFLTACLQKGVLNDASVLSAKQVIKMATENGAKALGFNVGQIKVGKDADIILINTSMPHWQPKSNLISHLVYSAKSSDVCLTMCGGKILYEDGKYNIGEPLEKIYYEVNKTAKRLKLIK